ncbi:Pleiotropic regulatory protein [Candidatus Terasakiella magnetica]|nr:Pleiotropic regulatory protein [Candidatus Terasakiella magnetica]
MIPFLDLKAQYRQIKDEVGAAIMKVVDSGAYVGAGPEGKPFEAEFAAYCGTKDAAGVNSGTTALHLALLAAGIVPGDEVITVAATFVATTAAILYANAKPVFVDVDPVTWTMDPARIEAAITPKTKAILPVHLHGLMADMDPIMAIAAKHGLKVIEDCAQAHGAEYKGRRAGTIGHVGCFSFYPGKNLGAYGEGGAIVSSDPEIMQTVRMLRDWGQAKKYDHVLKGFNARLDEIQAAVLRVKLKYIEGWTEGRRTAGSRYASGLSGVGIGIPCPPADRRHVYHVYAIRSPDRDGLQAKLQDAGVSTGIHYPVPVHLQKAYADLGGKAGDLPVTEALGREWLSLPMFAELEPAQADAVIAAVKTAVAR